jgi:hypothetical protein
MNNQVWACPISFKIAECLEYRTFFKSAVVEQKIYKKTNSHQWKATQFQRKRC